MTTATPDSSMAPATTAVQKLPAAQSRGSLWRKWDLHVHTPESYASHFREGWASYVQKLRENALAHEVSVMGVTDYFSVGGYERLLSECIQHADAPALQIAPDRYVYLLPAVELRIDNFGGGDTAVNVHVLFDPRILPRTITSSFLEKLAIRYQGLELHCKEDDLIKIGHAECVANGRYDANLNVAALLPEQKVEYRKAALKIITLRCQDIEKCLDDLKTILKGSAIGSDCYLLVIANKGHGGLSDFKWYNGGTLGRAGNIRQSLLNSADACFTDDPRDGEFLLGRDPLTPEEEILNRFRTLKPCIWGSDAHSLDQLFVPNGNNRHYTWIKADPTFEGLRQILVEPSERVFIGDVPPILKRVAENPTKYISEVEIKKSSTSTLQEVWFNCALPLNPGLVAIIGNKGSGKSALSDTLGLLGNTRQSDSFSFLNSSKFKQHKNNKARHFEASLIWISGREGPRSLDANVDATAVETVKYIPQNYLETVCNEIRSGEDSRFDTELKSVIFSHVTEAERLGTGALDELIRYTTAETQSAMALLRTELTQINKEIVEYETMLSLGYRSALTAQISEKEKEVSAHDAARPEELKEPETDPNQQAERDALADRMKSADEALSSLLERRAGLLAEQKTEARRSAAAAKLLAKIENLRKQYALFLADAATECAEIGIPGDEIVTLSISTEKVAAIEADTTARLHEIASELDEASEASLAARIAAAQLAVAEIREGLDGPQRKYQSYLLTLRQWTDKRAEIIGDSEMLGSLSYLQARLRALDDVPAKLAPVRTRRLEKAREIYAQLQSLATLHKTLYKRVQDAIEQQSLAKSGQLPLDFNVAIEDGGFEPGFFNFVNQQRKGSFSGSEDGRQALKEMLQRTNWNDAAAVLGLANDVIERLHRDHRHPDKPELTVADQLKRGSVRELYDFLFSFDYLKPKYNLRWDGRDLAELSPGERGTVLLLFYVLVDTNTCPLVIDQPEENLDNQTVFNVLVPAIKEARKRRQIVLVTHNPNLAVVCDADQVVYAEIDKKNGNKVTYESGSIEHPAINHRIIDVLEGTRPAFDNRDWKYQERPHDFEPARIGYAYAPHLPVRLELRREAPE